MMKTSILDFQCFSEVTSRGIGDNPPNAKSTRHKAFEATKIRHRICEQEYLVTTVSSKS